MNDYIIEIETDVILSPEELAAIESTAEVAGFLESVSIFETDEDGYAYLPSLRIHSQAETPDTAAQAALIIARALPGISIFDVIGLSWEAAK